MFRTRSLPGVRIISRSLLRSFHFARWITMRRYDRSSHPRSLDDVTTIFPTLQNRIIELSVFGFVNADARSTATLCNAIRFVISTISRVINIASPFFSSVCIYVHTIWERIITLVMIHSSPMVWFRLRSFHSTDKHSTRANQLFQDGKKLVKIVKNVVLESCWVTEGGERKEEMVLSNFERVFFSLPDTLHFAH